MQLFNNGYHCHQLMKQSLNELKLHKFENKRILRSKFSFLFRIFQLICPKVIFRLRKIYLWTTITISRMVGCHCQHWRCVKVGLIIFEFLSRKNNLFLSSGVSYSIKIHLIDLPIWNFFKRWIFLFRRMIDNWFCSGLPQATGILQQLKLSEKLIALIDTSNEIYQKSTVSSSTSSSSISLDATTSANYSPSIN